LQKSNEPPSSPNYLYHYYHYHYYLYHYYHYHYYHYHHYHYHYYYYDYYYHYHYYHYHYHYHYHYYYYFLGTPCCGRSEGTQGWDPSASCPAMASVGLASPATTVRWAPTPPAWASSPS
jgi:hypothetical protein